MFIGELPKYLIVNSKKWAIRSDFRVALTIFQAVNDQELNETEKVIVMLDLIYKEFSKMPTECYEDAIYKAKWFLNGGKNDDEIVSGIKIMDWEQDEHIIFSAVNKVASKEIRECKYVHWWTFLGYFSEIGEGLFSTVINIRNKKNRGKKLEKYEQEFYNNNKSLIDLKKRYTIEEIREMQRLNDLFK